MTEFRKLTANQQWLFLELRNEILSKKGIAVILVRYESENQDSYAEDIEAVVTVFPASATSLLSAVVLRRNLKALKDILNVVNNIEGLKEKILTENRFEGCDGKKYTLLGCAELRARFYHESQNEQNAAEEIVKIIQNMNPVPEEQQNQAAGPESPSFLSQHKGKFAIIGAVALVGTIAAFMSGYPIIGIIVALTATFMLATDKGRGMCDEVGKKLYRTLPECFKSKEAAKG
ncbi:MAG: hypothetical protein PG981_001324 [Wolbachia endosymbiont of Ctenocephalides orientis wCori]|nr:MAG: hypothetical protein PG981_001324 [Wolbachia endosymbiont of Ctenocephalides orientis wCori]